MATACPRKKFVEGKTSYKLDWKVKVMMKKKNEVSIGTYIPVFDQYVQRILCNSLFYDIVLGINSTRV